jgi:hypothetical protein
MRTPSGSVARHADSRFGARDDGRARRRASASAAWPHDLSDDEILARLLALNLERAAAQGGVVVAVAERDEYRDD